MEMRHLGNSGLEVSVIGLGCNNFGRRLDEKQTATVVSAAVDAGITLFDTADLYGENGTSETYLGKALKGHRDQVVIATKFGGPMGQLPMQKGGSRQHIFQAVEDSLRRLNTDYIDLYQMHFPDLNTPLEETMRALDDLVRQGKVRYLGHSNFSGWMIAHAHHIAVRDALTPFISAQNHYHLLNREVEPDVQPACTKFGLGILPYFPLASGLLTGKYRKGQVHPEGTRLSSGPMAERILTDINIDKAESLFEWAEARGHTLLELAFSWLAQQPAVSSVIAGATNTDQISANVNAANWVLTSEELEEIEKLLGNSS
ncbi:MAG: aldo/keto reductase [Dehalococcoidia bacterium]|nr:aldo/keto reductase [Dehalococcoidia bacterium]